MRIDNKEFEEINNNQFQPLEQRSRLFSDDVEKSFITIAEIIHFFLQKKLAILLSTLVLTGVLSYLFLSTPDFYIARVTFIPPPPNLISTYSDSLSTATSSSVDLSPQLSLTDPNMLFINILKSRLVKEPIINKLNLLKAFGQKNIDDTIAYMDTFTTIMSNGGLLEIQIKLDDAKLAADIANEYTNRFSYVLSDLSTADIKKGKRFLEKRLTQVHNNLMLANRKLKEFKINKRMVDVDLQKTQIIGNVVEIKNRIMNLEIELGTLSATYTDKSEKVKAVKAQIQSLKTKLNEKVSVSPTTPNISNNDKDIVSFYDIPTLTIDYNELSRDVAVLDQIYSMLHKEYEFLKIKEAKETVNLKIVDKAVAPTKPANITNYRKIGIISFISLMITLGIIFIQYGLLKLNNFSPENFQAMNKLKNDIKNDIFFWKRS